MNYENFSSSQTVFIVFNIIFFLYFAALRHSGYCLVNVLAKYNQAIKCSSRKQKTEAGDVALDLKYVTRRIICRSVIFEENEFLY